MPYDRSKSRIFRALVRACNSGDPGGQGDRVRPSMEPCSTSSQSQRHRRDQRPRDRRHRMASRRRSHHRCATPCVAVSASERRPTCSLRRRFRACRSCGRQRYRSQRKWPQWCLRSRDRRRTLRPLSSRDADSSQKPRVEMQRTTTAAAASGPRFFLKAAWRASRNFKRVRSPARVRLSVVSMRISGHVGGTIVGGSAPPVERLSTTRAASTRPAPGDDSAFTPDRRRPTRRGLREDRGR